MDNYISSFFLLFAFSHFLFIHSVVVDAKFDSFTIDLIHRNSKSSPFFNESATTGELFRDNALRSLSRINYFHQSLIGGGKIKSSVIPNGADYLMKISVGTPPVESYAIADTGSDLVWLQCLPCVECYKQDAPLFNPMTSSTYKNLSCDSTSCLELPDRGHGCGTRNECLYGYGYGDGSVTFGNLGTETFTFDSTNGDSPSFPNSTFGCGHNNSGIFNKRESGLVGLGAGPLSLISRLSDDIQSTFSYCLVPMIELSSNSTLRFGKDSNLSSRNGSVSTPLLSRGGSDVTFYYLNLEGASVGGTTVLNNETDPIQGNIIIDSGSTLTALHPQFYNNLEAAVKQANIGLNPRKDPKGTYSLCYTEVPDTEIVLHFTGGADVTLKPINLFRQINDKLVCMAIVPSPSSSISVYGNVAQINFEVEYDLKNKLLSFAPMDCSQF